MLPKKTGGYRDFREQIAFDPGSRNTELGCSRLAYWSTWGSKAETGRLYRTEDGGKSWLQVPNSESLAKGIVKVHPVKGWVYVANDKGFFKSIDGGRNFAQKAQGVFTGLDVVARQPDSVFACKSNEILISTDAGETFSAFTPNGLPGKRNLKKIRASPVNTERMVIENDEGSYQWQKYFSTDGGKTWAQGKHDNRLAFLPYNNRQPMFAWHPKDENMAWSFGGDWITRTTDGGATWSWANNGNTGIMAGGGSVSTRRTRTCSTFPRSTTTVP
mgnify:CR=1 FL=1